MATIRIILGILCSAIIGRSTEPNGSVLARSAWPKAQVVSYKNNDINSKASRTKLMAIARSQIGVREATGNNDGKKVEAYLNVTNLSKGHPWCAAFISWVFKQAGLPRPQTAWSPALFPLARQIVTPKPADVLGIYSIKLKRIAHCGLVERKQNNWIISIEGNTDPDGSRNGNGVYRKWRHMKTISKFADWVR